MGSGERTQGNTSLFYDVDHVDQRLTIVLFGTDIFTIVLKHWAPVAIRISFGGYYDIHGRPTTTTTERLNGLLNRLAMFRMIPDNVRVFRDQEQKLTYLGRFDEKIAVGERYAKAIMITPHPENLIMTGGELG